MEVLNLQNLQNPISKHVNWEIVILAPPYFYQAKLLFNSNHISGSAIFRGIFRKSFFRKSVLLGGSQVEETANWCQKGLFVTFAIFTVELSNKKDCKVTESLKWLKVFGEIQFCNLCFDEIFNNTSATHAESTKSKESLKVKTWRKKGTSEVVVIVLPAWGKHEVST